MITYIRTLNLRKSFCFYLFLHCNCAKHVNRFQKIRMVPARLKLLVCNTTQSDVGIKYLKGNDVVGDKAEDKAGSVPSIELAVTTVSKYNFPRKKQSPSRETF